MADSHISVQPRISVHILKMFIFTCMLREILLSRHCFDKKSIPVLNLKEIMRRKQVNILSNDQSKSCTCPITIIYFKFHLCICIFMVIFRKIATLSAAQRLRFYLQIPGCNRCHCKIFTSQKKLGTSISLTRWNQIFLWSTFHPFPIRYIISTGAVK